MPKTIVIVGGGFAGVECARRLEGRLPAGWEVVLFNDQNHTTFTPLLAEVVGSSISPLHVVWTIRQMLRKTGCHTADICRIDFAANEVEYKLVQGRVARQKYEHLVLACGMVVNTDVVPGAAAHSFSLKTMGDALALRNHLIQQLERADSEPDIDRRRQLLSFAILGGGFSGVEVAGEIFDLLTDALPFYPSLRKDHLYVVIIQGPPQILPDLPPALGEYAQRRMRERGIDFRLGVRVGAVTETGVSLNDGSSIKAGTVVCTVGNTVHPLVQASGLLLERGQIRTKPDMRVIGKDNVWAIGDCAAVINAFDGKPCPTLAQFAVRQGRQLAKNLRQVALKEPTRPFRYRMLGSFAAIGRHNAVGQMLGVTFSGIAAWFLWRGIYLSKMPTVARKVQIAFDWAWDLLFPRDICQLSRRETARIPRAHFQPGDEIFHQGDPAEKFYIVEKGHAGIFVNGWAEPVLTLGPGDFFGERELLRDGNRGFSVKANEALDLLTIAYGPFRDFLGHMQSLRTNLSDRITRIESLQELRTVVRQHPRLTQATVAAAMASPPPTILDTSTFASAISHFHRERRTAFVVIDERERLQGICTVTDLHNALCALRSLNTHLSEIMTRAVVTVPQSRSMADALTTFLLKPVKRLVVVADDDPGRPVGLLTPFDILLHYAAHETGAAVGGTRPAS